jgi:hypothetical protein
MNYKFSAIPNPHPLSNDIDKSNADFSAARNELISRFQRLKDHGKSLDEFEQKQRSIMRPEAVRPVQRGLPPMERVAATDRAALGSRNSFTKRLWGRASVGSKISKPGSLRYLFCQYGLFCIIRALDPLVCLGLGDLLPPNR